MNSRLQMVFSKFVAVDVAPLSGGLAVVAGPAAARSYLLHLASLVPIYPLIPRARVFLWCDQHHLIHLPLFFVCFILHFLVRIVHPHLVDLSLL